MLTLSEVFYIINRQSGNSQTVIQLNMG